MFLRNDRGFLAVENGDFQTMQNQPTQNEIDLEVAQSRNELGKAAADVDQLSEASSIVSSVSAMADVAEQAVASGDGLSPEAAGTIKAAMEHHCRRLGLRSNIAMVALEGYEKDRLRSSRQLAASLRDLSSRAEKQLTLAQEGILDRIGNVFSRMFTSSQKMRSAVSGLKKQDLIKQKDLGEPAWARVFGGVSGKHEIGPQDIVKVMYDLEKHNSKLASTINSCAERLEKIKIEMERQLIGSSDETIDKIKNWGTQLNRDLEEAYRSIPRNLQNDKAYAKVTSCDESSFDKIVSAVQNHRSDEDLDRAWNRFGKAYEAIEGESTGDAKADLALSAAKKMSSGARRAAMAVINSIRDDVFDAANTISVYHYLCLHGAYKYLLASTGK